MIMARLILSIACVLLLAASAFSRTADAPEGNLYLKALSACVEKQSQEYKRLNLGRDYLNRIVEKNIFLTEKLPTQIGEYRIAYLDGNELVATYKRNRKPIPLLSMRPMVNEEGVLRIGLVDYWFSFEKRAATYSVEGGCNVFFRYDCEQKVHVIEKVELWGV